MKTTDLLHLFTYGTLKTGFKNPFAQKLHAHSTLLGEGYFHGLLYRIDWYPAAIFEPDQEPKVFGEIFLLESAELLVELDEYEEVFEDQINSLYLRKAVPVTMRDGNIVTCWTYLFNQPVAGYELIKSGIFTN